MQKIKTFYKLFFTSDLISYQKLYYIMFKWINSFGKKLNDNSEYRMTQIFDTENKPTEFFYYSNYSLGPLTTYKSVSLEDFTNNFGLHFVRAENKHGIFTKNTKTKIIKFYGKSKKIVNSPYIIELNRGDYLALSNDLILIVPKNQYSNLFTKDK